MAEVAASVVAFVQAAEMCTKSVAQCYSIRRHASNSRNRVAQSLLRKLRAYRHANDRIAELVIRIEGI